jgi:hypothetical protein
MKFFRGLIYAGTFGLLCWVLLFVGLAAFTCSCASTRRCPCLDERAAIYVQLGREYGNLTPSEKVFETQSEHQVRQMERFGMRQTTIGEQASRECQPLLDSFWTAMEKDIDEIRPDPVYTQAERDTIHNLMEEVRRATIWNRHWWVIFK